MIAFSKTHADVTYRVTLAAGAQRMPPDKSVMFVGPLPPASRIELRYSVSGPVVVAVLEPDGKFSFLMKAGARPNTKQEDRAT